MAGSCSVAPAGTDQLDLEAAEQLIQLSGGDGAADAGSESRSTDSVKCRRKEEEEKEKGKEAAVESRRRMSAGRIPAAGKDEDGNGGGGESDDIKGADSFACCSATADADVVEKVKDKVVVESPRRSAGRIPASGKDDDGNGGGGESDDIKGVDSFACCSATAAGVVEEKEKEKEKEKVVVVESCRRRTAAQRFSPAGKDRRDGGIVHGEKRKRPRFRLLADIYRDTEPGRLTAGGGKAHADRDPPEGERKEKRRARPTR